MFYHSMLHLFVYMKKILLFVSILMTSTVAFAQQEIGAISILPKVGFNIANFHGSDSDSDSRIGLVVGAEAEYQVTDMISVSAGVLYSMQGAKSSDKSDDYKVESTSKFDYINIPILANVYVYEGLAVKLGLQPAFNVKADYKISGHGYNESGSMSDFGIDAKSFDLSIPVGVSYEYKNYIVDARYNFGVTKVADHGDARNSVFQFTFGYRFKL